MMRKHFLKGLPILEKTYDGKLQNLDDQVPGLNTDKRVLLLRFGGGSKPMNFLEFPHVFWWDGHPC